MTKPAFTVRRMQTQDLPAVAHIQAACPEAAQWEPREYLEQASVVVTEHGHVAGFAVARKVAPDELEILNLAVEPAFRLRGAGRALLRALLNVPVRVLFLEVRASNEAARKLYASAGFQELGVRKGYYPDRSRPGGPTEDAIVMKMQKW